MTRPATASSYTTPRTLQIEYSLIERTGERDMIPLARELAQRPDLAEGVAQVRRDMEEADRTYAMGLAALRQAAELTQVELARRMGVTQAAVSRIEQAHDLLLSTLSAYLEAVGGHATVIVRFADGHEAELDLSQLT